MNKNQPLLSICIPTYNRAFYLKDALENITSDPAFDVRVEIVISDNASTDNTPQIALAFSEKYSNIKYFRNEFNIKDSNFYLALTRGTGSYLRLFNDTLRFKEGALENMLDGILKSDKKYSLFFYQNTIAIHNVDSICTGNDIDTFINNVSYYTTWIANFGCWKSDLILINSPNRFSKMQLSQVDWTFQIVSRKNDYLIYFGDNFDSVIPHKKGGYNIFQVFIDNYFYILKQYDFNYKYIIKEKHRLLKYFVVPWLLTLSLNSEDYSFETDNKWSVLFRHYCLYPIFYWELVKYSIKKILNKKRLL